MPFLHAQRKTKRKGEKITLLAIMLLTSHGVVNFTSHQRQNQVDHFCFHMLVVFSVTNEYN